MRKLPHRLHRRPAAAFVLLAGQFDDPGVCPRIFQFPCNLNADAAHQSFLIFQPLARVPVYKFIVLFLAHVHQSVEVKVTHIIIQRRIRVGAHLYVLIHQCASQRRCAEFGDLAVFHHLQRGDLVGRHRAVQELYEAVHPIGRVDGPAGRSTPFPLLYQFKVAVEHRVFIQFADQPDGQRFLFPGHEFSVFHQVNQQVGHFAAPVRDELFQASLNMIALKVFGQ